MKKSDRKNDPFDDIKTFEELKVLFEPLLIEIAEKAALVAMDHLQSNLMLTFRRELIKRKIPTQYAKGIVLESENEIQEMVLKVEVQYKKDEIKNKMQR
ncbi:MAG: hypothetical protein ABIP35_06340 [Ginsengibacter sp.]